MPANSRWDLIRRLRVNQESLHSRTMNLFFSWPHYEPTHLHSSLTWMPASNPCGQHENSFYWFIFRLGLKVCLCQTVTLHCMSHYEYYMIPTAFRNQLNRFYFPLSAAHRVPDSKISAAMTFPHSLNVCWMDLLQVSWRIASNSR